MSSLRPIWIGFVVALCSSTSALAAQTFKLPVTVVPGSVAFRPTGSSASQPPVFSPTLLPVSFQVTGNSTCSSSLVTVDVAVVDGGLEIGIAGSAAGVGTSTCSLGGDVELDVEVAVPELGGSATAVRLVPEVSSFSFSSLRRVAVGIAPIAGSGSTSSIPGLPFDEPNTAWELVWADGAGPTLTPAIRHFHWVPGDTLRFRVRLSASMLGNNATSTSGSVRSRWEYRATVPEPSLGLSVPIGVLTLAWMASSRGAPGEAMTAEVAQKASIEWP